MEILATIALVSVTIVAAPIAIFIVAYALIMLSRILWALIPGIALILFIVYTARPEAFEPVVAFIMPYLETAGVWFDANF